MSVQLAALHPEVREQYRKLCTRYHQDPVFKAVVDMYRNLNFEPEIAAHWMAQHDIQTYSRGRGGDFVPCDAAYSPRELEFLKSKGIRIL